MSSRKSGEVVIGNKAYIWLTLKEGCKGYKGTYRLEISDEVYQDICDFFNQDSSALERFLAAPRVYIDPEQE